MCGSLAQPVSSVAGPAARGRPGHVGAHCAAKCGIGLARSVATATDLQSGQSAKGRSVGRVWRDEVFVEPVSDVRHITDQIRPAVRSPLLDAQLGRHAD